MPNLNPVWNPNPISKQHICANLVGLQSHGGGGGRQLARNPNTKILLCVGSKPSTGKRCCAWANADDDNPNANCNPTLDWSLDKKFFLQNEDKAYKGKLC